MSSAPAALPDPGSQCAVLREALAARARGPVPGQVRRIALVGNAPLTVSAERAARIDGADLVVRMTTFALDGDEPRGGRRTDAVVLHRATTAGPGTWHDYRSRLYLVAEPGRRHYEPQRRNLWWPADAEVLPVSNREFADPLSRELGFALSHAVWSSTGTLAVAVMHGVFPEAALEFFGTTMLDAATSRRTTLAHAWGGPVRLTPEHRPAAERRWLAAAVDAGWLTVPDRTLSEVPS